MIPRRWISKAAFGEDGFTFTELLVAITILALALVPILALLVNGYTYTVMSGRQTIAANLCRDKIEDLKSEGFSKYILLVRASPAGTYSISSDEDPLPEEYGLYRRETIMEEKSSGSGIAASYLRVKVTVYWNEKGGERSVEMETNMARG